MTKLILSARDDRPVKITVELPATVHRDLVAYVEHLNSQHVSVAFSLGGGAWPT